MSNEGIVSKAVVDNLIEQEHDLVDAVTQEVDRLQEQKGRGGGRSFESDPILKLTEKEDESSGKKGKHRGLRGGQQNNRSQQFRHSADEGGGPKVDPQGSHRSGAPAVKKSGDKRGNSPSSGGGSAPAGGAPSGGRRSRRRRRS